MCGRFNITDDPAVHSLLKSLGIDMRLETRYNIAPTESIPVIARTERGTNIHNMRWWLTPHWAPEITSKFSMFNAKSETVESSKAFRGPFRHRRGVIPANSFTEWKTNTTGKQPFSIRVKRGPVLFAALWDIWEKDDYYLESCTILTTAATDKFSSLHHRMPVLLSEETINLWLDTQTPVTSLKKLFDPNNAPELEAFPVDKAINNARNKDDRAITPIGEAMVFE